MVSTASHRALLALASFCLCVGCHRSEAQLPPGLVGHRAPVLLLLLDTLRADHTGFGGGRHPTHCLDGLAAQSIVFSAAHANASWTRPSLATLFSSRLPTSHGCVNRDGRLVEEVLTLAEVLSENGYGTRGVTANGNVISALGFGQGFDSYVHVPAQPYADAEQLLPALREALTVFDQPAAPGFLFLHFVDPHDPYQRHQEFDFARDLPGSFDGSRQAIDAYRHARTVPDTKEEARVRALYDGEIAWLDGQLARLFDEWQASGLLDRAWVIVTSDHGEGLWDHGIPGHGQQVFEEQLRVPLIVRPPGGLTGGSLLVDDPVALIDLAPTLLELLGVQIPDDFEGRSWAARLAGTGEAPVRPLIIDEQVDDFDMAAILDGHDKLIVDHSRRQELLFDLSANPGESMAQAVDMSVEHSARGTRLRRLLDQALGVAARRTPAHTGGGQALLPPTVQRQLVELGYVGEDG